MCNILSRRRDTPHPTPADIWPDRCRKDWPAYKYVRYLHIAWLVSMRIKLAARSDCEIDVQSNLFLLFVQIYFIGKKLLRKNIREASFFFLFGRKFVETYWIFEEFNLPYPYIVSVFLYKYTTCEINTWNAGRIQSLIKSLPLRYAQYK